MALRYLNKMISSLPIWRHETQHNDMQHNNTQHNDTQHNDTQQNDIEHKDTQQKWLICDTQLKLQCLHLHCLYFTERLSLFSNKTNFEQLAYKKAGVF